MKLRGKLRLNKIKNTVCRAGDRRGKRGGTYGGIHLSSSNEQRMNRCPTEERGEKYQDTMKAGWQ